MVINALSMVKRGLQNIFIFLSTLAEKCKSEKVRVFIKIEICFCHLFPRTGAIVLWEETSWVL